MSFIAFSSDFSLNFWRKSTSPTSQQAHRCIAHLWVRCLGERQVARICPEPVVTICFFEESHLDRSRSLLFHDEETNRKQQARMWTNGNCYCLGRWSGKCYYICKLGKTFATKWRRKCPLSAVIQIITIAW